MLGVVQMGGIGFVHYNMSQEEQVEEVEKVKAHSSVPGPDHLRAGDPSLDQKGRWAKTNPPHPCPLTPCHHASRRITGGILSHLALGHLLRSLPTHHKES